MLKVKLKENKVATIGTWLTLPSMAVAEMMTQAGFEWVTIDLEHSTLTTKDAEDLIRVIDLAGKIPLVRLSNNDDVLIKRVMDAGAHGIIVPMVKNIDDVEKAYKSMHYPTTGFRGVGLARAQKYGADFKGYCQWLKEHSVFVVQIEHIDAVNNLDEILSFQALDSFIIGPYDLSASMGIAGEFDHPKMLEALKKIEAAAKKYNKPAGIHIVEPDEKLLEKRIAEGYKFIAYGVDFRILESVLSRSVKKFKELTSNK